MSQQNPDLTAIYSSFPELRLMENHTWNKSRGEWIVTMDQLEEWRNFESEIMSYTRTLLPKVTYSLPTDRKDTIKVATEKGVVSKFNERVGEPLNRALEALSVQHVFAEYPMGKTADKCAGDKEPDFTIQDNQEKVRVVGEAKTPWTTHLSLEMDRDNSFIDTCRVLGKEIPKHGILLEQG